MYGTSNVHRNSFSFFWVLPRLQCLALLKKLELFKIVLYLALFF